MSFDDGTKRRLEEQGRETAGAGRVPERVAAVVDRIRTHVREWSGDYVDMRAARFER